MNRNSSPLNEARHRSFRNLEMLGNDFQTAPEQLVAIVVGELAREFFHGGVINGACVKADVFQIGAANACDGKVSVSIHVGVSYG